VAALLRWFSDFAPLLAQDQLARIGDLIIASLLLLAAGPLIATACVAIKLVH
jgi:hypothetical protein